MKGRGGKPLKTKDVRALIDACGSGDIDTVIHLLDKIKPNVSFVRGIQYTLLQSAYSIYWD